jgi:hypothetical protein
MLESATIVPKVFEDAAQEVGRGRLDRVRVERTEVQRDCAAEADA